MKGRHILSVFAALFVTGNLLTEELLSAVNRSHTTAAAIAVFSLISISLLLIASFLLNGRARLASLTLTALFAGSLGLSACDFVKLPKDRDRVLRSGTRMRLEAVITGSGLTRKGKPFIKAETGGETTLIYGIPENTDWEAGDTIRTTVKVSEVRNFSPDFDYVRYMERKGIFHTCFIAGGTPIDIVPCTSLSLKHVPERQRTKFSEAVDSLMPGQDSKKARAVVKALAYGYMDEIDEDTKEAFRSSGAMHLLALSGMHLSMIHALLSCILALAGNSAAIKRLRSVIILCVLWAYTVFTGCGMSILRAMTMVTIYEAGVIFGRSKDGLCALSLSAMVISVVNPYAPSDIGFQLSYAAMLGIFIIHPRLKSLFPLRNRLAAKLRDAVSVSVACQAATMPLIFLHFRSFPIFSLSINVLCSPLASGAMILIPVSFAANAFGNGRLAFFTSLLETVIGLFVFLNEVIHI